MRAIDADALKEDLTRFYDNEVTARKLIDEQPTIQPEPKRGKWIEAESQCGIKCSKCGYPVDDFCHSIDYIDLDYTPNYCPNCGRGMREE